MWALFLMVICNLGVSYIKVGKALFHLSGVATRNMDTVKKYGISKASRKYTLFQIIVILQLLKSHSSCER